MLVKTGPPRGGQKGSLTGGLGTQGDPWFRIVRIRMQNSSAQTMACGRDDVFFFFRAEIRTSADAMTLFCSSLDVEPKFEYLRTLWPFFCSSPDFGPKFEHLRTLWPFFAHHVILGHYWPKGPNEIFTPGPEISLGAPGWRYYLRYYNQRWAFTVIIYGRYFITVNAQNSFDLSFTDIAFVV